MLDSGAIGSGQAGEIGRPGQCNQHVVKRLVLHDLKLVLDQTHLSGGIGSAQFGRIGDTMEMRDGRPYARNRGLGAFQRHPRIGKTGRTGLDDPGNDRTVFGNRLVERRCDLLCCITR
jgi:hypothetical protein